MFHNGSNNDYDCTIKKLAEELEEQIECSGENTENYITFSVPTKKQNENNKTIIFKIKFINSVNVMSSSPSSLDDNLAERSRKDKCKTVSPIMNTLQSAMAHWYSNVQSATKIIRKSLTKI